MTNAKILKRIAAISCIILAVLLTAVACNNTPEATKPESEAETICYHQEEIVLGTAATCTEAGLTDGKKCALCGEELLKQEVIEALGHKESDWMVDKISTATEEGKKHTECLLCNIEMNAAVISKVTADHTHAGAEWVVSVQPTCVANGETSFLCECGKVTTTAAIAKTEHTEVTVLGTSPTCNAYGKTDGKKCSACGAVTASQVSIAPTGHNFDNGICKNCGMKETYGLWLVDGLGNPMKDVFVKVKQNGEEIKLLSYKGEFLSIDLPDGEYELELDLSQLKGKYTYDQSLCKLSPKSKTASIRVFNEAEEASGLFVGYPIEKDYPSQSIGVGSYKVTLTPNDYSFFVFYPTTAAIYTITYECDTELAISYHGSTFFVQGADLSEGSTDFAKYGNGLSMNVYAGNIGGSYVFAVKSTTATSCVLNIANAGEPGTRFVDEPWTPYVEDPQKVAADLAVEKKGDFKPIDLTDLTLSAVFNENDGYYHLNSADGPIIFIDLTSDSKYLVSLKTICCNQRMGVYIYDANGKVVEKRSYNELFMQYGMPGNEDESVSEAIRVPLTAKLADAIKTYGERAEWWKQGSSMNIISAALMGAPYNAEYAWLMYCGYFE